MQAADKPKDEMLRLMTLRSLNLLDTPEDDRFDRLTRLARRMFDVPIAMVTLIDEDRQYMQSCSGRDREDLPRDISFCGHAILGSDVYVIPNMLLDEKFSDNPLVLELGVRFYAGCPIKSTNGSKLGTVCIVDLEPRNFTQEDCETLQDLAVMVEREIASLELATHDELTGLLNRRGFNLLVQNDLNLCKRNNIPASISYIDINKFKSINDQFGHEEGDKALVKFSEILTESIRLTDILARLGGDEFTIFFMESHLKDIEIIFSKIQTKITNFNVNSDEPYRLEFSYGITDIDLSQNLDIEDLLSKSDKLMYEMKSSVDKIEK